MAHIARRARTTASQKNGFLALEIAGGLAIITLLVGLTADSSNLQAAVAGVAGVGLALVAFAMWYCWRPGIEVWLSTGVAAACLGVLTLMYFVEIR